MTLTKRCSVCGRFRKYEADDVFCLVCGNEALESECGCGRAYEYALAEGDGPLHCPKCGRALRGGTEVFEP